LPILQIKANYFFFKIIVKLPAQLHVIRHFDTSVIFLPRFVYYEISSLCKEVVYLRLMYL